MQKAAYVPQLVKVLRRRANRPEEYRLLLAFAKIGQAAVPQLLPLLDDPNPGVSLPIRQLLKDCNRC
jgi:hypothetical protein